MISLLLQYKIFIIINRPARSYTSFLLHFFVIITYGVAQHCASIMYDIGVINMREKQFTW